MLVCGGYRIERLFEKPSGGWELQAVRVGHNFCRCRKIALASEYSLVLQWPAIHHSELPGTGRGST